MNSEKQLVNDQSVNLFLLEKFLNRHSLFPEDVGDYMPCFFHFNLPDLKIDYLNQIGCQWVDLSMDEINHMGHKFFMEYIHPITLKEVFPRFKRFYDSGDKENIICDFQHIRKKGETEYTTCLTLSKISLKHDGFLTITQPLDNLKFTSKKIRRLIDENDYVRKHYQKYQLLTKREKQIIRLLLKGNNNPAIADQLFISRRTVEQHRKNINSKLDISSFADLFKFGYAFDLHEELL